MKKILFVAVVVLLTTACNDEENHPEPREPDLIPLKMEDIDGYRELTYNAAGKISELAIVTKFVDGTEMKSTQTLLYDGSGQLAESTTDRVAHGIHIQRRWPGLPNGRVCR